MDPLVWVKAERLSVADFLSELDSHEWQTPSLCPGWTVHDVAAHLSLSTRWSLKASLKVAVRARGNFDRMEAELARERASRFSPAELISQIRETAGSPKRTPGAGPLDPLVDFLVHGQVCRLAACRTFTHPVSYVRAAC